MKICNAFSLSMLGIGKWEVGITPVSDPVDWIAYEQANRRQPIESYIGHADTARLFSSILDEELGVNRTALVLQPGEYILVGQYVGPRLPEGATTLPEGASIRWMQVRLLAPRNQEIAEASARWLAGQEDNRSAMEEMRAMLAHISSMVAGHPGHSIKIEEGEHHSRGPTSVEAIRWHRQKIAELFEGLSLAERSVLG